MELPRGHTESQPLLRIVQHISDQIERLDQAPTRRWSEMVYSHLAPGSI